MGRNNGQFLPVVIDALKSHPSISSFLSNIWVKLVSIFMGVEFSSNENYYFYKSQVSILNYTPIKFSVLAAFGLVGIIFTIHQRKKLWGFYISILLQVSILLGFYVSGRLRTPLAALLIPFVAYAIVECFTAFKDKKSGLIKIAIALVIGYFLYYRNISFRTQLRSADMITVYGNVLNRRTFLKVVAAAAGRVSLEVEDVKHTSGKIAAMGIRVSAGVSLHGFALNANTDLAYFGLIVPCGIEGRAVASMQQILGRPVDIEDLMDRIDIAFRAPAPAAEHKESVA